MYDTSEKLRTTDFVMFLMNVTIIFKCEVQIDDTHHRTTIIILYSQIYH